MNRIRLIAAVALVALAFADGAQAQFYKGKTVTMIINYPAGGRPTSRDASLLNICPPTLPESRTSSSRTSAAPAA
jgi:hypothetical protein